MFSRIIQWAKTNRFELGALIAVLVVALALRLVRLPNEIIWNGDTARDMVVARHLWLYHEPLSVGHSAYGLRIDTPKNDGDVYGMSHYPTYYFRAMALLWGLSGDVYKLAIIVAIYQVIGLAVLYFGLRQVFGIKPALAGILVIALSIKALEHSLGVAIHPILPIFFGVFTLCVSGWQLKKPWLFVTAALLCVFVTLIHYSFLVCFGWVVAMLYFQLDHSPKKKQAFGLAAAVVGVGAALFLALHLEIIRFYGFWPFIKTFTGQYTGSQLTLSHLYAQFINIVLFRLHGLFPIWMAASVALTIGTIFLAYSQNPKYQLFFKVVGGFVASLLVLAAFKSADTFHYEQIVFFDYVLMAMFGVSCGLLFIGAKKETQFSILIVAGVVLTSMTNLWYRNPPVLLTKSIDAAKSQAQQLINQTPYPLEETEFFVSSYYSWDYESPTVIYWLEVLSGKKLVKLVDVYDNLGWPEPTKKYMIASCQRYPNRPNNERASCETWLNHYEQSGKYIREKELFNNENYRAVLFKKL